MKRQKGKEHFSDLERAQARMDRIFGEMVVSRRWVTPRQYRVWHPPTDVHETDAHYLVHLEVAGMKESDFNISLSDRTLIVTGVREDPIVKKACHQIEISYGEFRSEVVLPGPVDDAGVEATYADGFLRVVLPKRPTQKVPVVEI
jgi:HSP20 family protein